MIKVLNYMANTAQAKKRARQSLVRRERNVALKSKLRTFVKNDTTAVFLKNFCFFDRNIA